MRILKIINNNVVSSLDSHGNEIIVMGRGIGFKKCAGAFVDDTLVEKIFTLNDTSVVSKLEELFQYIPTKYLEISEDIIKYARESCGYTLRDNIYLSLTDHISFAVDQFGKGMDITNAMLSDIKCFYQKEYKIGQKALEIIKDRTGVALPDDEAGFIALHILSASLDQGDINNIDTIHLINDIMKIIKDYFQLSLDEESIYYYRFANHVKFLTKRLLSQIDDSESDDTLYETSRQIYPSEFECALLIDKLIQEKFRRSVSKEELGYLTVNLKTLLKKASHSPAQKCN